MRMFLYREDQVAYVEGEDNKFPYIIEDMGGW